MDKLDQFFLEDLEGELFLDVLSEDTTLDLLIDDTHRGDVADVDPASDDYTTNYLDDVDDNNLDRVIDGEEIYDDDDYDDDYDDFY